MTEQANVYLPLFKIKLDSGGKPGYLYDKQERGRDFNNRINPRTNTIGSSLTIREPKPSKGSSKNLILVDQSGRAYMMQHLGEPDHGKAFQEGFKLKINQDKMNKLMSDKAAKSANVFKNQNAIVSKLGPIGSSKSGGAAAGSMAGWW